MSRHFELCRSLSDDGISFVVVTLVDGGGHFPQEAGAKAIVTDAGLLHGTVGGGKVEAKAIAHAQERLKARATEPELVAWNLQTDVGMTCGGELRYLFESHLAAAFRVAVFGAGHVGQALVRLLDMLDCRVDCIDSREEWASRLPASPRVRVHVLEEPESFVRELEADTFFVCVSRGHAADLPVLEEIGRRHPQARYVGAIGSRIKADKLRRELTDRGLDAEFVERIRCPIGLKLGTKHPGEIAVSIVGEILQARD